MLSRQFRCSEMIIARFNTMKDVGCLQIHGMQAFMESLSVSRLDSCPTSEKPFLLLVTGYPAKAAMVPDINRLALEDIMNIVQPPDRLLAGAFELPCLSTSSIMA